MARPCFTYMVCFTLLVSHIALAAASVSPAAVVAAVPVVSPAATPVHAPAPAPAPKPLTLHEKVVGSLRAAGHYGAIAGLLDSFPDEVIKTGMTLFAPNDNAFSNVQMNSTKYLETLLSYHASPQVYSYQGLLNLAVGTKVPTTAPNVVIVVTSTTKDAYKLDDSTVVDPDIFSDQTISVQGIDNVLNTAKYNKGVVAPEAAPAPTIIALPPSISPPGPPAPPAPPSSDAGTPGDDGTNGPSLSPSASSETANPNDASSLRGVSSAGMIMVLFMSLWLAL